MGRIAISSTFDPGVDLVLYEGDCLDLFPQIPDEFVQLIVTSPPYNIGKPYERRLDLKEYLTQQQRVIEQCVRVLDEKGSLCWQVGNYKGPKKGQLSGHPLGKNPGDVREIPNVKANHVEKTIHPCQFPVELVERLVLALTDVGDWVFDPFIGVGSTAIAALMHGRRAIGAEIVPAYVAVARERIRLAEMGALRIRPMERPVFDPEVASTSLPPRRVVLGSSPVQLPLEYLEKEKMRIVYEYSRTE